MTEHRQFPRVDIDVECFIEIAGDRHEARTRNLSRNGVACVVDQALAVNEPVTVELALSFAGGERSEPMALPGLTVWCTPVPQGFQIGVRFSDMTVEGAEQLDTLISFTERARGR